MGGTHNSGLADCSLADLKRLAVDRDAQWSEGAAGSRKARSPWSPIIRRSLGPSACRLSVEGSRADVVRGYGQVAAGVGRNLEDWLGLPLPPSGRSSVQCKCAVQHQMAGTQNVPALSQLPVQSELGQSDQARAKAFRVGAGHKQVRR